MANNLLKIISLICYLLVAKVYAQQKISWSPLIDSRQSDMQFIVGDLENKTFILNKKSGFFLDSDKWFIDVFQDSSMQKIHSNEIKFIDKGEIIENTYFLRNKNVLITSLLRDKNYSLNAYAINNDGQTSIFKQGLSLIKDCNSRIENQFQFILSNDSQKVCVYHNLPKSKEEEVVVKVEMFNTELSSEYTQVLTFPYKSRETIILDAISVGKQVAFLVKVADDDKLRIFTNRTYTFYIVNCNMEDGKKETISLGLKKRSTLLGSTFYVNKLNRIGICGFYRHQTDNNDNVIKPFKAEFNDLVNSPNIQEYSDDYAQPKISLNIIKDLNPYEYKPLKTLLMENGNIRVVCEKEFTETSCLTDFRSGMQRCNYYFHSDNIECHEFDETQDSKKNFTIEKKQISINDDGYYLGSLCTFIGTDLYIIYNDSKLNANSVFNSTLADKTKEPHFMNTAKKANVVLAKVDLNGNVTKQILFTNYNTKTAFVPNKSYISASGKVIFYCKRSNKYKIGYTKIKR